jgi:oxygen-independent coproporphyrinogen-3 oxidase
VGNGSDLREEGGWIVEVELNREEFINQYPPFNLINTREVGDVFSREGMHLYVHIPFCKSKCGYCYFKSFDDISDALVSEYLASLRKEIRLYSEMPEVQSKRVKSLYFGGGTPTLLSCAQLEDVTRAIVDSFDLVDDYEFCVEANPDEETLTAEKIALLKELNIRRISFGVQNFNDEILRINGRLGSAEEFFSAYDLAKRAQVEIVNIDILSGMIGETWPNWQYVVDVLIQLAPESIAFYKMELYYNTKLFKSIRKGEQPGRLMSNEEEIGLIRYAYDRLQDEGGYVASNCYNLVRDREYEHLHTNGIWQGDDMIGLGLSSHSCFNGFLYQNAWNMKEYNQTIGNGALAIKRAHKIPMREEIARAMVYGIKRLRIDRARFVDRFGFDMTLLYGGLIRGLVEAGYLSLDAEALKVPREYYIFADDISRAFFLPEHRTMMLAHMSRVQV